MVFFSLRKCVRETIDSHITESVLGCFEIFAKEISLLLFYLASREFIGQQTAAIFFIKISQEWFLA